MRHLRRDPVMKAIIQRAGPFAMTYGEPTFESLARSIVGQQLSTRVARVIYQRLVDAMPEGHVTPAATLKLRPAKMRTLGLSGAKTEYIRDLARHTRDGKIRFEELPGRDLDYVIEHLTQVKGIGVWTAHMFLIFALRHPDVMPVGDLGIRTAVKRAYGFEELPKPAEIEELAVKWRPYCSIASWYLWRSLEGPEKL
jgi:DNA-3-methyladenine glycosylase II